jgi:hypothetical protein
MTAFRHRLVDRERAVGLKNLLDENYRLGWGFPMPGRTSYLKTRMTF